MAKRTAPRRIGRLHTGDDGMTLIETVVAIGLVTALVVSLASGFVSGLLGLNSAAQRDRGGALLTETLNDLRNVPWPDLGAYSSDNGWTTTSNGESRVNLGSTRPTNSLSPLPLATVSNAFGTSTVTTAVTWVNDTARNSTPPSTSTGYDDKRLIVTVTYSKGHGQTATVTGQTIRSADPAEQPPSRLGGTGPVSNCTLTSPLCSNFATSGQVLASASGATTAPVLFSLRTLSAATAATVAISGGSTITLTADDPSNATSWSATVPTGTTGTIKGGVGTLTWKATIGGSSQSTTSTYMWRWPVTTAMNIAPVGLVYDTTRTSSTDTSAPTTTAQSHQWLCVSPSWHTWNYEALEFDVQNIDDMDAPAANIYPQVTRTRPVVGPTAVSTKPGAAVSSSLSNSSGSYNSTTGYVGTSSSTAGSLNTQRWAYALPAGTTIDAPATSIDIVVTVTRPADGMVAEYSIPVVVHKSASASSCSNSDTTTQPVDGTSPIPVSPHPTSPGPSPSPLPSPTGTPSPSPSKSPSPSPSKSPSPSPGVLCIPGLFGC